jgi:thiamine-phosphate pyrophosphorylase
VPFFVNDDVATARECHAAGVHLGQQDLSVGEARRILAPGQLIGLSTHNADQALAATSLGVDYIGLGPVFPTDTKPDAEPVLGLDSLQRICARVTLPVVAIGGITRARATAVARAGATAAAAISAVLKARDIERAANGFHNDFLKSGKGLPGPP